MILLKAILSIVFSAHGSYFDQYLSEVLQSQRDYCTKVVAQNNPQNESACLNKIQSFINAVDHCDHDPKRIAQANELDKFIFAQEAGELDTNIPANVLALFKKITTITSLVFPTEHQIQWQLNSYQSADQNGFAGASGKIILSTSLWHGSLKLSEDELAAIIAHESAHVAKKHRLQTACHAFAWEMNEEKSLLTAMIDFKEELRPGYPRAHAWEKLNQQFELEADADAILILKAAGLNPLLMAKALEKIKSKKADPFSPATHPEINQRIRKATNLALNI